jgi:hypothetical protein
MASETGNMIFADLPSYVSPTGLRSYEVTESLTVPVTADYQHSGRTRARGTTWITAG